MFDKTFLFYIFLEKLLSHHEKKKQKLKKITKIKIVKIIFSYKFCFISVLHCM